MHILWNTPYPVGGVTSVCVHLHKLTGWPLLRLAKVSGKPRPLGQWGAMYSLRTVEDLIRLPGPLVLGGGSWQIDGNVWERLFTKRKDPTYWVFHDETEFRSMPHVPHAEPDKCIVLREHNLKHFPSAELLPQPYNLHFDKLPLYRRTEHAVCIARIDPFKRPIEIVLANRELPEERRVALRGSPNRMYVFGKKKKYPELAESKGYPSTMGAGAELCANAHWSVDLCEFGEDAGMQYTTLEALDGGAVPVISKAFSRAPLFRELAHAAVDGHADLADLMRKKPPADKQRKQNRQWLFENFNSERLKAEWNALL